MSKRTLKKSALINGFCIISLSLIGCQAYDSQNNQYAESEDYPINIAYLPEATPDNVVSRTVKNENINSIRTKASSYLATINEFTTASGERYDPLSLTAAHNTLPLSTFVKVRNLNNQKETIVKINDRSKTTSQESIQLSYAAAYKLGIYAGGQANVEIIPITFASTNENNPSLVAKSAVQPHLKNLQKTSQTQMTQKSESVSPDSAEKSSKSMQTQSSARKQKEMATPPQAITNLSPQTAQSIHLDNKNTLNLKTVQSITPSVKENIPENKVTGLINVNAGYSTFLQVGAFRDKENANALLKKASILAKESSTEIRIYEMQILDKPMYKVRFGPFKDEQQIHNLETKMASNNLNSLRFIN